jgi:hypothetical protein
VSDGLFLEVEPEGLAKDLTPRPDDTGVGDEELVFDVLIAIVLDGYLPAVIGRLWIRREDLLLDRVP